MIRIFFFSQNSGREATFSKSSKHLLRTFNVKGNHKLHHFSTCQMDSEIRLILGLTVRLLAYCIRHPLLLCHFPKTVLLTSPFLTYAAYYYNLPLYNRRQTNISRLKSYPLIVTHKISYTYITPVFFQNSL